MLCYRPCECQLAGERRRRQAAFTLIEMLLVIVIIAILAGALVTSLAGRSEEARITRARSDISGSLSLALDMFETDVGRYPTEGEGLDALVSNDDEITGWRGPYLKGGLKPDPWGNAYTYARDSDRPDRYMLQSAGPDGQVDTEDDIVQQD